MKKEIIFLIFIVFITFSLIRWQEKDVSTEESFQTIPDEAIRLRILANSDSDKDQKIKKIVRNHVNDYISDLVQHIDQIEEARKVMNDHVPEIEKIVATTLKENAVDQSYTVEYRSNVTFPMKIYDHYVYPAGEYEAILISIGEARGSNWWCVLFPPLCFLDFSNGATVASSEEDSEEEDSEEEDSEEIDITEEADEEEEFEIKFFLFEWLGLS